MTKAVVEQSARCGWEVKIEKERALVLPGSGLEHTMLHLLRHPDGSLYMNAHKLGLYRSSDDGQTWSRIPLEFPDAGPNQDPGGFGISRDGRLWVAHQSLHSGSGKDRNWKDLFISSSADGGQTWKTAPINYADFAPQASKAGYEKCSVAEAYSTFIEQPDGTLMFSLGLIPEGADIGDDVMLRSPDGGKTWGDPTFTYRFLNACECSHAADPENPDHILTMARCQRKLLPEEDRVAVEKRTGCPPGADYVYKNGLLLESNDAGRSFREVAGGLTGYYEHRGTILWTRDNVVIVTYQGGIPGQSGSDGRVLAGISLDGGKTWLDDTAAGTPLINESRKFVLVDKDPGHSYTSPTVELSANRFLTVYCSRGTETISPGIYGLFWRLEQGSPDERAVTAAEQAPADIGNCKQLFIDDYIIESLEGLSKNLNQPVKYAGNSVLPKVPAGEPAWDAEMIVNIGTVIFDDEESLFKMWYGLWAKDTLDHEAVMAYATSKDGITWHKPSLGLFHYRNTIDNNIVVNPCGGNLLKDLRETDPARRYKMFCGGSQMRICVAFSADGIHWVRHGSGLPVIFHPPGHDGHTVSYWDEHLGRYVAIIRDRSSRIADVRPGLVTDKAANERWRKLWGGLITDKAASEDWQKVLGRPGRKPENHSIRGVGQVESDDFIYWSPMRTVVVADAEDPLNRDEFYNMEVMPYEGMRVGLMTVFSYGQERPRGAVQLTYSRDGMNWHRGGNREVFLPVSERPEDFDWGTIYPVQGPLVVGDEIWIYYIGWGPDHNHEFPPGVTEFNSGIGLAKLRLDGFISVDAGAHEGTLITRPFTFRGGTLVINADAGGGSVVVEIQDDSAKPVKGLGRQDCDAFTGDAIRHTVTWRGKTDLKSVEGKTIRLRFHLTRAKIFSFVFRD